MKQLSNEDESKVKTLFVIRIVLCSIALLATVYWIYWSFKIWDMGIFDPYEYVRIFRPKFGMALLVTALTIGSSMLLRRVSDNIKKPYKTEGE